ncbi:MAG: hypothetical protein ACFFB5_11100 [Promethearchaeota archaeon]
MADDSILILIQIFNAICCLIGFVIFVNAWRFARKIEKLLEETRIVKKWRLASLMVGFFSLGYLINVILVFSYDLSMLLIVEGLVFLIGSLFVLLVFYLAFKTYDLIYSIP